MLNTNIVKVFKLINKINISIKKSYQIEKKPFSFNSKANNKDKNSKPNPASNTFSAFVTILFNKITNTYTYYNHSIEELCNFCIKSKHIKIVRHKKIILTNPKFQKIYVDL